MTWNPDADGVLRLPSGRLIRGRRAGGPPPAGPLPQFALILLTEPPPPAGWEQRWVRWPDFRLPTDRADAAEAFGDAWRRCARERVDVACAGGRGRTGTALACIAVLDGVPAADAVQWVRQRYHRRAVETPWQRRYVGRFSV